jgi:hypothetical protein
MSTASAAKRLLRARAAEAANRRVTIRQATDRLIDNERTWPEPTSKFTMP